MPTPGLHGIAAGRFAAKVNLNTIRKVKQPRSADDDLRSLRWPALQGVSRQFETIRRTNQGNRARIKKISFQLEPSPLTSHSAFRL